MFDLLEALVAVSKEKTMQKAALRLKTTQPTISKRIAALEREIGQVLTEPKGRGIRLTPVGQELAGKVEVQLSQLQDTLKLSSSSSFSDLHLGVSESVLLGHHGAIANSLKKLKNDLKFIRIHSQRSPLVFQEVLSGKYDLGIVTGDVGLSPDQVTSSVLIREPFCLVWHGSRLPSDWYQQMVVIDSQSSTWQEIENQFFKKCLKWKLEPTIVLRSESFASVTLLAMEGFGVGLVPFPVALRLRQKGLYIHELPEPGLERRICVICRKTALKRNSVKIVWNLIRDGLGP